MFWLVTIWLLHKLSLEKNKPPAPAIHKFALEHLQLYLEKFRDEGSVIGDFEAKAIITYMFVKGYPNAKGPILQQSETILDLVETVWHPAKAAAWYKVLIEKLKKDAKEKTTPLNCAKRFVNIITSYGTKIVTNDYKKIALKKLFPNVQKNVRMVI